MKAAAEELGLKVKTIENVDARGQDAVGQAGRDRPGRRRAGAGRLRHARERARASFWRRQRGEYFIVRTDRVTPARIPALTEVEAKVVEAWQAEERRKLADAKVKAALEKANGRHRPRRASPRNSAWRCAPPSRSRASRPISRQLPHPAGGAGAVQAGSRARPSRCAAPKAACIVRLKQIEPVDLAKDKEALDRFGKQLDSMVANDLILQLLAALRTKYGVTVDEAAFAAAFRPQQQP